MLESRKDTYYRIDIRLHTISDYLWIYNIMPNKQHLVNEFNYPNMMWTVATYATDEVEFLFNISRKDLE